MLHNSYSFRTSHIHYVHVTSCMVFLYLIYRLDFSVIVITFSSRYYFNALLVLLLYLHILSFIVLLSSCTLAGPLMNLYYFSVSRSERRHRELIINHILVQLFCDEFSLFPYLACLIQMWWMILFMFQYFMCF